MSDMARNHGRDVSKTQEHREAGNEAFSKARDSNLSTTLRKFHFQKAIGLYLLALSESNCEDDEISCLKNSGIAKIDFSLFSSGDGNEGTFSIIQEQMKNGIQNCLEALNSGSNLKPLLWKRQLIESLDKRLEAVLLVLNKFTTREECINFAQGVMNTLISMRFGHKILGIGEFCYSLAEWLFHAGVCSMNELHSAGVESFSLSTNSESTQKLIRDCLESVGDCYSPLQEADSHAGNSADLSDRIQKLRDDIYQLECSCKAIQALRNAHVVLNQAMKDDECFQVDGAWAALDFLKEACLKTREKDIEIEAMSLSRTGHIYGKVLKIHKAASVNYHQALRLGSTLMTAAPRITKATWYKEALEEVDKYQSKVVEDEERDWSSRRQPFLEELKEELAELSKQSGKGAEKLLSHIYIKHPPKSDDQKMGSIDPEDMKKTLKRAILHYHPDKNCGFGSKWKVLCEEITKALNREFTLYK